MKRQLIGEEREVSTKQLARHKKELSDLQTRLRYNKKIIQLQAKKRELENFKIEIDDEFREFLRSQKDEEDEKIVKRFEADIKDEEKHIKILEEQLNKGVEIPSGVQ